MFRSLLAVAVALSPIGAPVAAGEDPAKPPPPAWTGSSQISFLRTSGNTETSVLGLAGELKYQGSSPWSTAAAAAFNRGSVSGEENLRNLGASLRAARSLDPKSDLFLEFTYASDSYAGIDSRAGAELGLARKLTASGPHALSVEAGFGLAREVRLPMKVADTFAFGRAGLTYKYAFSKTAEFENAARYVANLKHAADWRLLNLAAISAALNSKFSVKLSYSVNHLNTPPALKKKTDATMAAALVARF